MSNKLYTKEMFLQAAEKCEISMIDAKHIIKYIDEYVTPIELPTDEEIEEIAFRRVNGLTDYLTPKELNCLREGYMNGMKLLINIIQGGNKWAKS